MLGGVDPDEWGGAARAARRDEVTVNNVVDAVRPSRADLVSDLSAERRSLRDTLAAVIGSRSAQEEFADRSYWHQNGFMKVVMKERPGYGQLRLHIWPQVVDDDDIHGHSWHYASVVLGGELKEVEYRESSSDEGDLMWRHRFGQTGHRSFELGDSELVRLQRMTETSLRPGAAAGGSSEKVHRFYAVQAPAATMLRVGPLVARHSSVYRVTRDRPQAVVPRPTTRADVAEWLAVVGEMVAAAGG
jgi:hypothetical protein